MMHRRFTTIAQKILSIFMLTGLLLTAFGPVNMVNADCVTVGDLVVCDGSDDTVNTGGGNDTVLSGGGDDTVNTDGGDRCHHWWSRG